MDSHRLRADPLFPSSAPTDVTGVSTRDFPALLRYTVVSTLETCANRSSPNATYRINMDSHRLRTGPLNESISDTTPLLGYTATLCNIPAQPAYYTSGLYYFVRLRVYDFLARP
jgi:hypothetical protein